MLGQAGRQAGSIEYSGVVVVWWWQAGREGSEAASCQLSHFHLRELGRDRGIIMRVRVSVCNVTVSCMLQQMHKNAICVTFTCITYAAPPTICARCRHHAVTLLPPPLYHAAAPPAQQRCRRCCRARAPCFAWRAPLRLRRILCTLARTHAQKCHIVVILPCLFHAIRNKNAVTYICYNTSSKENIKRHGSIHAL